MTGPGIRPTGRRLVASFSRAPRWLVIGIGALTVGLLLILEGAGLDEAVFLRLNDVAELSPAAWVYLTVLGDGLVCAVLLLPWIRSHPERVWSALLGAIAMVVILRLLKGSVGIPRPLSVLGTDAFNLIGPPHRRTSFPSGHAATAFLYVGVWIMTARRRAIPAVALGLATLVGISRIVVGVHWPSDVLAGMVIGWVSAWLGLRWAYRMPFGIHRGRRVIAGLLVAAAVVLLFVDHTGYAGVLWFQRSIALVCLPWGVVALWADRPRPARKARDTSR